MHRKKIRKSCTILLTLLMSLTDLTAGTTIVYAEDNAMIVSEDTVSSETEVLPEAGEFPGTEDSSGVIELSETEKLTETLECQPFLKMSRNK